MKKYLVSILFFLSILNSLGQTVWQTNIPTVSKSGYYNIELSQQAIGLSQNKELTDLRILDNKKKEVPYFLRSVDPIKEVSSFEDYTLKENITKDSLNIVIVDNSKNENINRFYIIVRSADVDKYANVRGSNDLQKWYIVKQKTSLSNFGYKQDASNEMLILDIPQGNYKYYEITLSNTQSSPLEVVKLGKMKNSSIYGQFTKIDIGAFTQKENSKDQKTYINFSTLADKYRIDKLELVIKNKADFFRQASLIDSVDGDAIGFELSSKSDNAFFVDHVILSNRSVISIDNNNNPPLVIDSIHVYGLNRYLCAYLEEGQQYDLQIDEQVVTAPNYDIGHFQNDIPADLPIIKTDNLHCTVCPQAPSVREPILIERPIFLWGVIVMIGLFLTLICVKMIKELKKRK